MAPAIQYDVYLASLPTHDSLATAFQSSPAAHRELVFVRATDDEGNEGWGECSALNTRGYTNEWARGAFGLLTSGFQISRTNHPMAFAGLEMAELDLELKRDAVSLGKHLGLSRTRVPAGAVVGLGTPTQILDRVNALVAGGYRRVKLKITSGDVLGPVEQVRRRFPDIELQVDANGSLGAANLDALVRLAEFGVIVIEQPFAVNDTELTTRLRAMSDTLIFADEAVRTVADAMRFTHFDGLVIKPGPSGGLKATLELLTYARTRQLAVTAGGMLESGLGRHFLAALSGLDSFSVTGDVSPARRWLAADPWSDLEMDAGDVVIPDSPGVAPGPDKDLLKRFTVARGRVLLQQ